MGWFDKTVAGIFPEYAIRRIRAKQFVGAYESARTTRTHRPKREERGANSPVSESAVSLRQQARYLEQNNDIAKGALDTLVNMTVGMGILPQFMIEKKNGDLYEEVNEQLAELHEDWRKHPEVSWLFDETSAQRIGARTFFRDGEVLLQHVLGTGRGVNHGSKVPYSYELIEPDMLPMGLHSQTPRIVSGVEINGWGRATAYHLLKIDPNDTSKIARYSLETRVISADKISHLASIHRIRQYRGVSVFSSVIKRLQDIEEIDETERVASRMAAAMAVVIKKGDPTLYNTPENDEAREINFEPGMIIDDLLPGEEITSIDSNRPNPKVMEFKDAHLRNAAAGIGISYSSLSKNYNGTYSAQRQELVEQRDNYGVIWKYFVERGERPKLENFIRMAVLSGQIILPPDVKQDSLTNVYFTRPKMPWIQPLQEAKSFEVMVKNRFMSTDDVIRGFGEDPKQVKKALAREEKANGPKEDTTEE